MWIRNGSETIPEKVVFRASDFHRFNDIGQAIRDPHDLAVLEYPVQLVFGRCCFGKRACGAVFTCFSVYDNGAYLATRKEVVERW